MFSLRKLGAAAQPAAMDVLPEISEICQRPAQEMSSIKRFYFRGHSERSEESALLSLNHTSKKLLQSSLRCHCPAIATAAIGA
jgi:hypothetical protein